MLKQAQKTWIEFFANLKKLKKHEFHFLQSKRPQKNMNLIFAGLKIFCKLQKASSKNINVVKI